MNDRLEAFQVEFFRILEMRSRIIVALLNDEDKTKDQKLFRIRSRLVYDTGHLNELSRAIEECLKEQERNAEEVTKLKNLMYRLEENSYFDETEWE